MRSLSPALLALLAVLAACGSSSPSSKGTVHDAGKADVPVFEPGDAGSHTDAAHADAAHDAGGPAVDASAMRNASCTTTRDETGTAVDTSYGRLDGTLVYVVDVGTGQQCNGDNSHVHLQVEVSGSVYDIAVDVGTAPSDEVGLYEETIAVPGGAWSEGWHGSDGLAYPSLGLHDTSFPIMAPDSIAATVEALLTDVAKVSIFCKGYTQGNGCHDVHYENGSTDGAIILTPTEAMSKALFFRFQDQSF